MNLARVISTCFGIGKLSFAPGTWASLFALIPAWLISTTYGWPGLAVAITGIFCLGWWASKVYINEIGTYDPPEIVIDEIAGQWCALLFIPTNITAYLIVFFLFRLFDIWKPWPISLVDRNFHNALAVMIDDIMAGIMAVVIFTLGQLVLRAW